jgi:hypothetical protein
MVGCKSAIAVIPLSRITFDALFHGRSGYRAQYYLSAHEGSRFNRLLLDRVIEAIRIAHKRAPTTQAWWVVERSLQGRWSKVWVRGDGKPFQGADRNEFRPKRWVENFPLSHWLAAPIPEAPAIDIKGSWIDVVTGELRQDPNKEERDNELFQKGGA